MHMIAQTATIESGPVYLPKDAPWLPDYLMEMTTFPKGKYNDQVDSTSQALYWIKSQVWVSNRGLIDYMKAEYEAHGKAS